MNDTIAAISTPAGVGGIAVIRISGKDAVAICNKIFYPADKLINAPSHTVHYGYIINEKGEKADEVLATVMRAPKTFTCEDVVEIGVHGGSSAPYAVLSALFAAGARAANPGEFTERAFLNGRIDLSQAEAVADIINADNASARKNAMSQLCGSLSAETERLRAKLVHLMASMQVSVDYPDEGYDDVTAADIRNICCECEKDIAGLIATADSGKILTEGIRTVIVGKPNVGKSSLLNRLLDSDRAIVTDIAGTTRDVIEEKINFDGIPIVLTDTAGIHSTSDKVEEIGVKKSLQYMNEAALVLVMLDAACGFDDDDLRILNYTKNMKRIILINKTDISAANTSELPQELVGNDRIIEISALNGFGIDALRDTVAEMFRLGNIKAENGIIITNMRHKAALEKAREALAEAVTSLDAGMAEDMVSIDIRDAVSALGEITGETVSESIVNDIFHNFCVGK